VSRPGFGRHERPSPGRSYLGSIDDKIDHVNDRLNSFDVLLHRLATNREEGDRVSNFPDHHFVSSQTQTILIVFFAIFIVCALGGLMLALGILGI